LSAQFNTQVDPADASGPVGGVVDESVTRAEGKHPNLREQVFAPLRALADILARNAGMITLAKTTLIGTAVMMVH